MSLKTIWVVDDDPIYQIIANKIIKKSELFLSASSFKNGKDAIDVLKKSVEKGEILPNIILLDINMPIMDGWEFMEEMVKLKSQISEPIQIYIVSSSIALEDKSKAKNYSDIIAYLSKPIDSNDLILIAANI
ncbi:response regulator receiver domain-containing protein [Flavobacterium sp. 103]|uniref:response regulator n=1 Tax=unclassified Flavobacterium TaxID=196869 RepID=UPI000D5CAAC7|nr:MULTISPECIES: response regulator [unclassified Flavobacterium]PVX47823.1 response regulator receiver domain-containing protein [Flavobacterium sp. 103]QKJ63675.1 response regulator [Flavobacterium sp. M31R6]